MSEPVLIKLSYVPGYCAIRTYTRTHHSHGRFLISAEIMAAVLEDSGERYFYDTDCSHMVKLWRKGDFVCMQFLWLTVYTNDGVTGLRQQIVVPRAMLCRLLDEHQPDSFLYRQTVPRATIDASRANQTIHNICEQPLIRRAFIKAMRDQFHWPGNHVTLMRDGPCDFFFLAKGGIPIAGGLILHETTVNGYPRYYYSIHT